MRNISALLLTLLLSTYVLAQDIVIDVRTPQELKSGYIKDALNIDFRDKSFTAEILKLNKNASYKLYCRSGNRSGQALQLMKELGFKNLQNLGSFEDARKALGQ